MSTDDHRWRGTSPDERAGDRRTRLMLACYELVGCEGSAALSVRAVCRAANVGPRHFYELFPDIESLLLATYEHAVRGLFDAVSAAMARNSPAFSECDVATRLSAVFDAATVHLEAEPHAGRLIFQEALAHDVLRARAVLTLPAFVQSVRQQVSAAPQPAPAYQQLEAQLLSGGLAAAFVAWLSGSAPFTRDELVRYCTQASLALLTLRLPGPPV